MLDTGSSRKEWVPARTGMTIEDELCLEFEDWSLLGIWVNWYNWIFYDGVLPSVTETEIVLPLRIMVSVT